MMDHDTLERHAARRRIAQNAVIDDMIKVVDRQLVEGRTGFVLAPLHNNKLRVVRRFLVSFKGAV